MEEARKLSAFYAVDNYVKDGMIIILGTGRAASLVVERIAEKFKDGFLPGIRCVSTSTATETLAKQLNLPMIKADEFDIADIALDGADAIHLDTLALIKGKGAALLREKMLEERTKFFVVVVDESKICRDDIPFGVDGLPVDIVKFCWQKTCKNIEDQLTTIHRPAKIKLRPNRTLPIETDDGNFMVEVYFEHSIFSGEKKSTFLEKVKRTIENITGVVGSGLFLDMAHVAVIGGNDGKISEVKR